MTSAKASQAADANASTDEALAEKLKEKAAAEAAANELRAQRRAANAASDKGVVARAKVSGRLELPEVEPEERPKMAYHPATRLNVVISTGRVPVIVVNGGGVYSKGEVIGQKPEDARRNIDAGIVKPHPFAIPADTVEG